jgi:hypothetical protein
MGVLSLLGKTIQFVIEEATMPESFKTGEKFENYARDILFIDSYYDLVERTHNYITNSKDYVESSLKPDFTFRDHYSKKEFYVEAKFRSGMYNGKITWCNESQLKRYQQYNKQKDVFLILGFGEDPKRPDFLSLIPLVKAKYTGLYPSLMEQFEIKCDKPVTSKILWNR